MNRHRLHLKRLLIRMEYPQVSRLVTLLTAKVGHLDHLDLTFSSHRKFMPIRRTTQPNGHEVDPSIVRVHRPDLSTYFSSGNDVESTTDSSGRSNGFGHVCSIMRETNPPGGRTITSAVHFEHFSQNFIFFEGRTN